MLRISNDENQLACARSFDFIQMRQGFEGNSTKKGSQSLNIVMDSTGLKIYGEGEWKVRMHGVSKLRTGRKLHAGANPEDGEIQTVIIADREQCQR